MKINICTASEINNKETIDSLSIVILSRLSLYLKSSISMSGEDSVFNNELRYDLRKIYDYINQKLYSQYNITVADLMNDDLDFNAAYTKDREITIVTTNNQQSYVGLINNTLQIQSESSIIQATLNDITVIDTILSDIAKAITTTK